MCKCCTNIDAFLSFVNVFRCLNKRVAEGPKPFEPVHEKTNNLGFRPGPEVTKLFSCSAQLRLKFILLINVKMPTIVGILTFMSRINY